MCLDVYKCEALIKTVYLYLVRYFMQNYCKQFLIAEVGDLYTSQKCGHTSPNYDMLGIMKQKGLK